jgi:hypothetical protein
MRTLPVSPRETLLENSFQDSSLIRPLCYLVLIAIGITFFAVICLKTPDSSCWEIAYPSRYWKLACLWALTTMIPFRRLPAKVRVFIGVTPVLLGIFFGGSGQLIPINFVTSAAEPAAFNHKTADQGVANGTRAPHDQATSHGMSLSNYKGHFSAPEDLPPYGRAKLLDKDWATVGGNFEVWRIDAGIWADRGYNIQKLCNIIGPSGMSARTDNPFTIPCIGSVTAIPVKMPWADPGDTVCVTDGTHHFTGTVVKNTDSGLRVLNSGFTGNDTGAVAAGSLISICAPPNSNSCLIYGSDEFLSFDSPTDAVPKWSYAGTNLPSISTSKNAHAGILSFGSGATSSINELMANREPGQAGSDFTNVKKCLVRFVVSCDSVFSANSFDGEWYVGLGNPDGSGAVYGGALLNFAPGFRTKGLMAGLYLLAGSYTSVSKITYTPTPFEITSNTWYDLIISWTPTAIKYYAAVYGETPTLIATHTTNISTIPQFPLAGNNRYTVGTAPVTLFIDRVEWLYETSKNKIKNWSFSEPVKHRPELSASFSRIRINSPPPILARLASIFRTLCPSTRVISPFPVPLKTLAPFRNKLNFSRYQSASRPSFTPIFLPSS